MPMEIRRFGVGNRRPDGPPGTRASPGQVIHARRPRRRRRSWPSPGAARIEPHSNPNTTWFVVIEGGGFVRVGDERARVAAGEAVLWPADVLHAAWTELSEMRAIVVEFAGADDAHLRGILDGAAAGDRRGAGRRGEAAERPAPRRPTASSPPRPPTPPGPPPRASQPGPGPPDRVGDGLDRLVLARRRARGAPPPSGRAWPSRLPCRRLTGIPVQAPTISAMSSASTSSLSRRGAPSDAARAASWAFIRSPSSTSVPYFSSAAVP